MIRPLIPSDRESIKNILIETKVFNNEEVVVALELIDIFLHNKDQKDYDLYTYFDDGKVFGYICIGPTPMTFGTYDLYWIAVDPDVHGKGIGKKLVTFAEEKIKSNGGRLIILETSSRDDYEDTRQFYIKLNYIEISRIRDYYKIGDDLVVYGKYF